MEEIKELTMIAPIATPVILGLVQVIKNLLPDSAKRFIPLVALAFGVGASFFVNLGREIGLNAIQAIIVGLLL